MKAAGDALSARKYGFAIDAYKAALIAVPNDPAALKGLSDARYSRAMAEGMALLAEQRARPAAFTQPKKDAAITAFQAALAERPNDRQASVELGVARAIRIQAAKQPDP